VGQYAGDLLNSVLRELAVASPTAARDGLAEGLFKPASSLFATLCASRFSMRSCSLAQSACVPGAPRRSGVVAQQGLPDATGAPQSVHPAMPGALHEMTEPGTG